MLMQNFGVTNKEHYGMLWYFKEWAIGTETLVRHDILSSHLLFYDALLDTAISRKVVGKNVHATIPKGNMGYDQYTVPDDCSCRTYFCCFPLALANTFPWPFVPILSNFFSKRELKTTHNAFKDCRVHFSRQPFSKQLYLEPIVHVICIGLMVLEST